MTALFAGTACGDDDDDDHDDHSMEDGSTPDSGMDGGGNPEPDGSVCCAAAPVCDSDETSFETMAKCSAEADDCHAVSICCSTIYCGVVDDVEGDAGGDEDAGFELDAGH